MWTLGITVALAQDCPPYEASIVAAQAAVVGYRFGDADAAIGDAVLAIGCAKVDDPRALSRLLRTYGARRLLDEDVQGGERAFAAAKALHSDFERDLWGDVALGHWFSTDAGAWGTGEISVVGASGLYVDGQWTPAPIRAAATPHLVRSVGGKAWLVEVPMDGAVTVTVPPGEPAAPPGSPKARVVLASPDPVRRAGPPKDGPRTGRIDKNRPTGGKIAWRAFGVALLTLGVVFLLSV